MTFADSCIIGGPAREPNTTWLYLSGDEAKRVAACFTAGPLQTRVIGANIGKPSALKMCFAAYTKGTTALMCAMFAAAEGLGVRAELERQWSHEDSSFVEQADQRIRRATTKAWRFTSGMDKTTLKEVNALIKKTRVEQKRGKQLYQA